MSLSTRSKGFLKFLQENMGGGKIEDVADYFRAPKIHENSVFIYQSRQLANAYRFERATEIIGALFLTCAMHEPMWVVPVYGLFYVVYGRVSLSVGLCLTCHIVIGCHL